MERGLRLDRAMVSESECWLEKSVYIEHADKMFSFGGMLSDDRGVTLVGSGSDPDNHSIISR